MNGEKTKQLKKIQGVVAAAAQNSPDRYGIRIGEQWYGGFGTCPVEKGAVVEVAYVENGIYRNVKEIELLAEQTAEASSDNGSAVEELPVETRLSHDSRIARAVALKCAVEAHKVNDSIVAEAVLKTAEKFERWLNATSPPSGAV